MNNNKIFWSRMARVYNKFTRGIKSNNNAYKNLEEHIILDLNSNMSVLEIGSGPGTLSNKISDYCKHLTITDFSEQMIREAKKNVHKNNVDFEIADATHLKYDNNKFDVVVIANTLHIMPNPVKALDEIKRVIKPNGLIICPTFTRENIKSKNKEKFLEFIGFKTFNRWTNKSFIVFLEENDLEIIKQDIIYGYNFPISYIVCKKNC